MCIAILMTRKELKSFKNLIFLLGDTDVKLEKRDLSEEEAC